jgi:hypothetical protein
MLQILAGNKEFSLPWYRTFRYKGYLCPKRASLLFRYLIRAIDRDDFKSIRLVLSAVNIYQCILGPIEAPETTFAPVTSAPVADPPPKWSGMLDLALKFVLTKIDCQPSTRTLPTGQSVAITPVRTGSYSTWVSEGAPGSEFSQRVIEKIQSVVKPFTLAKGGKLYDVGYELEVPKMWQGNLRIVGDKGGKSRLILIGTPAVQARLRPLQTILLRMLWALPTDCTYDQSRGIRFILDCQQKGIKVYSVDLKDATWHFPFTLQQRVLETLGGSSFLPFFRLPVSKDGEMIEVQKGQAMGLMPSFPLFALTHNLILTALCKWLGRVPIDTFRVLGDDLIIADGEVRDLYLEFARDYEIPLSAHKCLESSWTAEFAGQVIYKGTNVTPIRWNKLGGEQLPALFYSYRDVLGQSVYKLITDKDAFLILGGLPKSVGGLGISGFDSKYRVPRSLYKARLGIVLSRLENLGLPKMKGTHEKIKQEPLGEKPEYLPCVNSSYLRGLGKLLEKDRVLTRYGYLPYMGPPGQVSRQLGIDIPLLPKMRSVSHWEGSFAQPFIRRYYHAGADSRSRDRLQGRLKELINEYSYRRFEFQKRQAEEHKSKEENASKESPSSQEVERTYTEYIPTLFYE